MEQRFKLLKKYPGLPDNWKLGMIVGLGDRTRGFSPEHGKYRQIELDQNLSEYPEFWEPVVEKKYEILALATQTYMGITKNLRHIELFEEGHPDTAKWTIHKVKRLSDGAIFEVGKKAKSISGEVAIISAMKVLKEENDLYISVKKRVWGQRLSNINPYIPLGTLSDGTEVDEKEKFYLIRDTFEVEESTGINIIMLQAWLQRETYPTFRTVQEATNFIVRNKPIFSIKKIEDILHGDKYFIEQFNEGDDITITNSVIKCLIRNFDDTQQ